MDTILKLTGGRDDMTPAEVLAVMREYFQHQQSADAEFLIACATDTGAKHFLVNLHGRHPYPPFELFHPPSQFGTPYTWVHFGPEITLPARHYVAQDRADLPSLGLEVMEMMRKEAGLINDTTERFHLIGGGVDYTTISRKGVHTNRLKDWPDRLGEFIDPTASED